MAKPQFTVTVGTHDTILVVGNRAFASRLAELLAGGEAGGGRFGAALAKALRSAADAVGGDRPAGRGGGESGSGG